MTEVLRILPRPDGAAIAYGIVRAASPRPLLVLVHGMASNMTRWSEFFARTSLAERWDLVRVDLRGHGRSPWRGRTGFEIWSDDLAALLDAEGYAHAVVGGHCLGANFALHFAARYPSRASGLVLIEPMPPEAQARSLQRARSYAPLLQILLAWVRAANAVGLYRHHLPLLDLEALDRDARARLADAPQAMAKRYASPLLDLRYMATASYLQDLLAMFQPLPAPASIAVPVLALVSTGRHFTEPEAVERWLAAFARATIERVAALHWIPTEQPQAMRAAIERWCAAHAG